MMAQRITNFLLLLLFVTFHLVLRAQDLEDMLNEAIPDKPMPVIATFKSPRIINLHSNERVAKGNLEFRISHRFGQINSGIQELFGIDQGTIRFSLDYGITDKLMVGVGRSGYQKTYDGYIKYGILQQIVKGMPISLVIVSGMSINTTENKNPNYDVLFSTRLAYFNQIIIARKFTEKLSLELAPTWVHLNLVPKKTDLNDIPVLGIGGRYKIAQRVAITMEYNYRIPIDTEAENYKNYKDSFSVGCDIETGGHVFQLHATNSQAMVEKGFFAETSGDWTSGGIYFGFNITREFALKKKH